MGEGFRVSPSGESVRFDYAPGSGFSARFGVAERTLSLDADNAGLAAPRTQGLDISGWRHTLSVALAGRPLALEDLERSRSLAISADSEYFALGTGWYVRLYDRQGDLQWHRRAPATAWAVNITEDGRLVVAAFGDGTLRWYRLSDGQELLAFFPHADRRRWVLWTPSGYYDTSSGAEDLIGWYVHPGPDRVADFLPASRFRNTYHRPDVVARVLSVMDESEALKLADAKAGRR